MIHTEIWRPGSNIELDSLFETLRQIQYEDSTHSLHLNYAESVFQECEALSITFDNDNPVCCSSILHKNFWPNKVYRILNRFWKVPQERFGLLNRKSKMLRISNMIKHQLEYSQRVLESELIFISRHEEHWQQFLIDSIKINTEYRWQKDQNYHYQTCLTPDDNSCWQRIIFYGNSNLLNQWNRK